MYVEYVWVYLVCDGVGFREAVAYGSELAVDVQHGTGGQLDGQLQTHQVIHREPYIHIHISSIMKRGRTHQIRAVSPIHTYTQ